MSPSEKRRAGTAGAGWVSGSGGPPSAANSYLRAGAGSGTGAHMNRNTTAGLSTSPGGGGVGTGSVAASTSSKSDASGSMPAMPRAAMISNSSSPDALHESATLGGGASVSGSGVRESSSAKDLKDKDKQTLAEGEAHGLTASSSSTTTTTATGNNSIAAASKGSQGSGNMSGNVIKKKSAVVAANLLKEKDERIAYLEREMSIMEREFQRELEQLSQNESETATFWQGKHSALNQQFLRTDTELRLLQTQVDVREGEREELRRGIEMLRVSNKEKDDEVKRLRAQVRGLKEFVSTSTRSDGQTSDEVFGDGMARLGNGLQNWVIVNFRKSKIDLDKVDEATFAELSELVPMIDELAHTSKVHLLQSIVSRVLVDMVFDAYYAGLSPEQAAQFQETERLLTSFATFVVSVNHWRSSTLHLIHREHSSALSSSTATFIESVTARIERLMEALLTTTTTSSTTSEPRTSALRTLVSDSVDLARLLVIQKAVFKVHMPEILPHQQVMFDVDSMEDMGGEDEEGLLNRELGCVVFPGIIKRGDENGEQMQFRNVIAKARVLCRPED